MIRNIVFDLGNVLMRWDPDSFLRNATGHYYAIVYGDFSKELEYICGFYGVKLVMDR